MSRRVVAIGSPDEVDDFAARQERFFEHFERLRTALEIAFVRDVEGPLASRLIFYLGWRSLDDFWEILLLAANGHGLGATAHLRGMFERVVTAAYLHVEPLTAQDFVDYEYVRRYKISRALQETFSINPEDQERFAELEKEYQRVRERFIVRDCAQCGSTRVNHTWSQLDVVSMAAKVSATMGRLKDSLVPAYYLPLTQAHSTFGSITPRLKLVNGRLAFEEGPLREAADRSFQYAHLLLLNMLNTQFVHFAYEPLDGALKGAFEGYRLTWLHTNE